MESPLRLLPLECPQAHSHHEQNKIQTVTVRETERGGPCRPIETEVNRDSGSTYDRVSFLGSPQDRKCHWPSAYSADNVVHQIQIIVIFFAETVINDRKEGFDM